MTVRAKFVLNSITRRTGTKMSDEKDERGVTKWVPCEHWDLEFSPVYGNGDPNHENTKFWQASPSGKITLGTINPAVVQNMDIGMEYYVDFTPAPR